MFQVVTMWNLARPDEELGDSIRDIELRGYNPDAFLTGEFAAKVSEGLVRSLSVSDIADKHCPVARDVYFRKGANRLHGRHARGRTTWGRIAGNLVEGYVRTVLDRPPDLGVKRDCGLCATANSVAQFRRKILQLRRERHRRKYSELRAVGKELLDEYQLSHQGAVERLAAEERHDQAGKEGDTEWLLRLLDKNGRAELAAQVLHSLVREDDSVDPADLTVACQLCPTPEQIGLTSPVTPDFMIASSGIVGDIKTGVRFRGPYQLTCAGYALAYENQFGRGCDINWGVVYFFPTRNPGAYVKPLTFAQIYVFAIDDNLRGWFISERDEAYSVVSTSEAPAIPSLDKREHCPYCVFRDHCVDQGLELAP